MAILIVGEKPSVSIGTDKVYLGNTGVHFPGYSSKKALAKSTKTDFVRA